MTMPNERTRAVIWAIDFLRRLGNPYLENGIKRVPSSVRKEAIAVLRHFPHPHDLKYPDQFDEAEINEYYEQMEKEWAQCLNTKSTDS